MKCEQCGNHLLSSDAIGTIAAMFTVTVIALALIVPYAAWQFRARDLEHEEIMRKIEREQGVVKIWERPR